MKKNLIKLIKIFKKLTSSVQFWFHKPETQKLNKKNRIKSKPNPLKITKKNPKKIYFLIFNIK